MKETAFFSEICPHSGSSFINWREFYNYRDLFYFLVWRDVIVRYKQTALGISWAIIQPLSSMLIFTVVFGRLVKISSDGMPYELFSYSGLIVWTFYSYALSQSSMSLISNERMITKVYFPRLMIPIAPVVGSLVDFAVAFVLLLILMPIFGVMFTARMIFAPLMLVPVLMTAIGCGALLGALNVRYRDFRYVLPFVTQFWMFATPVVYPVSIIPEGWRLVAGLNPLSGAIEGFRWAVLGVENDPWLLVVISTGASLALMVAGIVYFQKTERFFADFI